MKCWCNLMRDDFKKFCSALRYLNLDLKNPREDYQTRFILQKMAYILKVLGFSLNYDFNLYIHGPYCRILTEDYYNNPKLIENQNQIPEFDQIEKNILEKIKKHVLGHKLAKEHLSEFLETVATILFFKVNEPSLLDDDIFAKTKEEKYYLKDWMITVGINVVKKLLFHHDFVTEEVKKEIDTWNLAND